jgi:serine/threonine-protein kinase
MQQERWERLQAIFHQASDLQPSERSAYLQRECRGDETLHADAEAMLAEDALGQSLLDRGLPPAESVPDEDPAARLPADAFGPYRIQRILGRGGMGIVYLAERENLGGFVAIKLLVEGSISPSRRERFNQEQKILAKFQHPFIAQIHDADTLADGTPWFAMEYVDGLRITDYCRERGSAIDERLELFRSVCEAVQHAHAKTVIHCDLKPSNIMVKADGTVKLLDFGIARQLEGDGAPTEPTRTGMRPMTLAYAAPEQVRCDPVGTQTDVYALGVVLYELLTGRLPFDLSNKSQAEAERTIQEREPEPPSVVAAQVSHEAGPARRKRWNGRAAWGDLDVLTLTAMHKDTGRRYRSVEALMRDIDHFTKGEPLEARPDTLSYRFGKFIRRNQRLLSATGAVFVVGGGLAVFFAVRLARARSAELAEATRTQRIERFMLNLFDADDRAAGPADDLRAVALLDRGMKSVQALSAEPAVQAELYETLGGIYQKLGKFDRADSLLRSALERRKSLSGPDNPDVADDLVALGLLRQDQGNVGDAERLVRDGLAMNRRHLLPDAPAVARSESALGRVLEERGAYDEAVKTLTEAVRLQSERSEAAPDLAESLSALATAQNYLGKHALADSLHNRALAMHRRLYGDAHPRVADDLYNLGTVQHDLGRDADAERDYRQALAIKQSWYGAEHPDSALMLAAVGQSLIYQGRYDEAAPVLQQALATQERIFGKVHPQVAQGLNQLALLELRRGHLSDAEKDFARMADINRSVYGDRHYLVGISLLNLGKVYAEEKDNARAEQYYREALSRFTEKLPPGHATTAIAQVALGHVLVLEGRYKDAESPLLAGYGVLAKDPGPQAERIRNARTDLAAVYDALDQPDKAKALRAQLAASSADHAAQSAH